MGIALDVWAALGFGESTWSLPVRDASIFPPMTWRISFIFLLLADIARIHRRRIKGQHA
jgi:hypothetical protein